MLKAFAKRWLRPLVIPVFRGYVRYWPVSFGKLAVWGLVAEYLSYADHPFRARTKFGALMQGNSRDFVQRHVFYFGLWEPSLTQLIKSRLREGDFFVDVGANVGYYTLLASRLAGPTGRVIALEPSPIIFPALERNIALNRAGNVVAHRLAASDRDGEIQLHLSNPLNLGASSVLRGDGAMAQGFAAAKRLCDLLGSEDWRRVKFIKIDVEGAEGMALAGLKPALPWLPDDVLIFMEVSPKRLEALGITAQSLLEDMRERGFSAYRVHNQYLPSTYLPSPVVRPPERLDAVPTHEIDIVFSQRPL